ncbi:MAG: hypothetical protein ACJAVF_001819, partial [Paraglaciecola sp.]
EVTEVASTFFSFTLKILLAYCQPSAVDRQP